MSFLGIFSYLRRPLKPCCSTRLEAETFAWKKLDSFLKEKHNLFPFLRDQHLDELLLCKFRSYSSALKLWQNVSKCCNEKLVLFGEILTKQCHFYTAQRLVRFKQVGTLYQKLYTERSMQHMVAKLVRRLKNERSKSFGMLLGATLFSWETEKITENDLKSCIDEFDHLSVCKRLHTQSAGGSKNSGGGKSAAVAGDGNWSVASLQAQGWEPVIRSNHLHVWRKCVACSYLYEYKVFGSFFDIPAWAFFSVQMDTEYRKKWDKLVISLDVIDKDERDECEVIHWVMHYPYPMYSRDYVYIRRALVDQAQGVMVLMSRATDHPECPADKKYVRVKKYFSQMVIRPHKQFDDTGFDYVLTYFDDPEAAFPAPAYNWMASSGVPDFVEKLHSAARGLYFKNTPVAAPCAPSTLHHGGPNLQQVYA